MEKPRESNVERLRTGILEMIEELGLGFGDRLPTEKEMVERFQISRPTLREALKLLEQEAVIDSHQARAGSSPRARSSASRGRSPSSRASRRW